MEVLFTHCCPHCLRKRRMGLKDLGVNVFCRQCGKSSIASDPSNESLAMNDSMKVHAELAELPAKPIYEKVRIPR